MTRFWDRHNRISSELADLRPMIKPLYEGSIEIRFGDVLGFDRQIADLNEGDREAVISAWQKFVHARAEKSLICFRDVLSSKDAFLTRLKFIDSFAAAAPERFSQGINEDAEFHGILFKVMHACYGDTGVLPLQILTEEAEPVIKETEDFIKTALTAGSLKERFHNILKEQTSFPTQDARRLAASLSDMNCAEAEALVGQAETLTKLLAENLRSMLFIWFFTPFSSYSQNTTVIKKLGAHSDRLSGSANLMLQLSAYMRRMAVNMDKFREPFFLRITPPPDLKP